MLRVHRIPFSANVERVALAAAHKGVAIEWVDHDPADRSALVALSGQELVPVLETDGGEVICDSPVILRWLEGRFPSPPLWPIDSDGLASADIFIEWFNLVWKRPPNLLVDPAQGTPEEREAWSSWLRGSRDIFEGLLARRDYLLGNEFSIADVIAWPFLRHGGQAKDPADDDPFHEVLRTHMNVGGHPRLAVWIDRCAALPQA